MKFLSNVLFIVLPLIAMQYVRRNEYFNEYRINAHQNETVLMYLDLTMYVMMALAIATIFRNAMQYWATKEWKQFSPTIFITMCTVAVTVFNVFIYETDIEKQNKALLAQELQQLKSLPTEVNQREQQLIGYWIEKKSDGSTGVILHYDKQGQETILIKNTAFTKGNPSTPYVAKFEDDWWHVKIERYGGKTQEQYMRFVDENTIVAVHNFGKGISNKAFRKLKYDTMTFQLERITEQQLHTYQQEAKREQGAN